MTDIPTATLNAWRTTLDSGANGTSKPRAACISVRNAIDAAIKPPVVVPPPPPPPTTALTPHAPVKDQNVNLSNVKIAVVSGDCVLGNNGNRITIALANSELKTDSGYCIYAAPSTKTVLNNVKATSTAYYVLRGIHEQYESQDSTLIAGHSWRVYGCNGGFSKRDTYDVGQLRCGGGAADEWNSEQPFANFVFEDDRIQARQQVTIYDATHDVVFRRCDFAGTGKIFIDLGAKNIRFEQCVNLPVIDVKGQTQSQLAARGIVIG